MEAGQRMIQYLRNHALFSICAVLFFYQSNFASTTARTEIYLSAVLLTLAAIWTPRRLRGVLYYVSVAAGTIVLAGVAWLAAAPHVVPVTYYTAAIILFAGTPNRIVSLGAILGGTTLLVMLLLGAHPGTYWAAFGYIGLYLGVRSRHVRNEAEEMRVQYVAELESALAEIRSAHAKLETDAAQSMHYAAQAERARIARDIHDGLGHQLTSLIVQLQALSYMLPNEPDEVAKRIPLLVQVARTGLSEVRRAVRTWESDEDTYGLTALLAVIEEARTSSGREIAFEAHAGNHDSWSHQIQITLYRILQETLTNAIRHSNASHIDVRVEEVDGEVQLTVADNGRIAPTTLHPGFGLRNMAARCQELHGRCTWSVQPDGGVTVVAALPLEVGSGVILRR